MIGTSSSDWLARSCACTVHASLRQSLRCRAGHVWTRSPLQVQKCTRSHRGTKSTNFKKSQPLHQTTSHAPHESPDVASPQAAPLAVPHARKIVKCVIENVNYYLQLLHVRARPRTNKRYVIETSRFYIVGEAGNIHW